MSDELKSTLTTYSGFIIFQKNGDNFGIKELSKMLRKLNYCNLSSIIENRSVILPVSAAKVTYIRYDAESG